MLQNVAIMRIVDVACRLLRKRSNEVTDLVLPDWAIIILRSKAWKALPRSIAAEE